MVDLIVIGGGPGGYIAAIRAAQLKMSVTLVEKEALGGVCLNRGCIPTKTYYQNAAILRLLRQSEAFNITTGEVIFDMAGALARKQKIVSTLTGGISALLAANGVQVIKGVAYIPEPGKVVVNGETLTARRIILATGSISARPPIVGANLPKVVTSDELLNLDYVPKRMVVVGGGVIGLEFACILAAFGSTVTVIELAPEIMGAADREIAKRMRIALKKQGIVVHTGTAVTEIAQHGDNLQVKASINSVGLNAIETDLVLLATGRKANTEGLNLGSLGVAVDRGGFIIVNEQLETSVPGIYAVGDVIGGRMLAHVASEEGRVTVEKMAGYKGTVPYHAVPSVVFTFPEMATVGYSEEEAKADGIEYRVGKFQFAANSKAVAMGDTEGVVKVLADMGGTIIGVHILGPHAADLIQVASVIVKNRLRTDEVSTAIHPHPTLGESLLEAILDVDKRALHLAPRKE
ncbi:MAG: dihydrolipoyl dehydrogenase [Peptococcaceae bacterium]|nr:dihydrolipoyl dehydrogenase [Peptococcaceae bacterium]